MLISRIYVQTIINPEINVITMWQYIDKKLGEGTIKKTIAPRVYKGKIVDRIDFTKHFNTADIIKLLEVHKDKIPKLKKTRQKWIEFIKKIEEKENDRKRQAKITIKQTS